MAYRLKQRPGGCQYPFGASVPLYIFQQPEGLNSLSEAASTLPGALSRYEPSDNWQPECTSWSRDNLPGLLLKHKTARQ